MSLIGEIGSGRLTSAAKAVSLSGKMESAEISGSLVQPELSGISEQLKIAAQLERIIYKGSGDGLYTITVYGCGTNGLWSE